MTAGLWTLDHDAGRLDGAAEVWAETAAALTATADDVNAGATAALGTGWEGLSAEGYAGHRSRLLGDVDGAAALATRASRTLAEIAGSVRASQGLLDASWSTVSGIDHSGTGDAVEFLPADEAERGLVETAVAEAQAIREELDATLGSDLVALDTLAQEWTALGATWEAAAAGDPTFHTPADADETGILVVDGVAVVNAGSGSDDIEVYVDPSTGETLVSVNGVVHRLPAGSEVVLRGGSADDSIAVADSVEAGVTVLAGQGDDTVAGGDGSDVVVAGTGDDEVTGGDSRDRIFGGAGQDYLDGQDGGDLVDGGLGSDTVYGLGGRDTLAGGEGDDYLEGGESSDVLQGGAGDDVVSGGSGDDTVLGGGGVDVLYAGTGDDTVDGGDGSDTAYVEEGDEVSSSVGVEVDISGVDLDDYVDISGSPEFVARVRADLELLAASPNGQELLAGIRGGLEGSEQGTVVIRESVPGDPDVAFLDPNGEGDADYVLGYDPTFDELRGYTPPSVVLAHELAHLHAHANGDVDDSYYVDDKGELIAVGLPVDHDGDPDTPDQLDPDLPYAASENGLRDELGLPPRDDYVRGN